MTVDVEELRKLLSEATPAPWDHRGWDHAADTYAVWQGKPEANAPIIRTQREKPGWDNAALIVAAVNALPELLAAAEAVERVKALMTRAGKRPPLISRTARDEGYYDALAEVRAALGGSGE